MDDGKVTITIEIDAELLAQVTEVLSENEHKDGNRKCAAVSILVTLKNPSILLCHGKL